MVQKQGAEIGIVGSPFSDVARSERRSGSALGFAPVRHTRTLKNGLATALTVSGAARVGYGLH